MAKTAGDVLVETLIDWGVDVVFGIPGDGVNGIIEAFRQRQDKVRFIQVRHEESAAFMACAWAKWTGRLGVCVATSGPGGIHLLNGLYDAKLDGQPVLAITGLQYHDLIGTFTQQDVELDKLFMDVAVYNTRIMGPAHVENVVELACRSALAYRGVAHITMAVDQQHEPLKKDARSERNLPHHVSNARSRSPHVPPAAELDAAAAILNAGEKVAILAGQGALGASAELAAVAERLAAPVAKALLGKAALSDSHPHCTGGVGLLGTRPSQEALQGCDTLLIVGSGFPYIEFYPRPGKAKVVQIDHNPQRVGLRTRVDAALVGDAADVLEALLPRLEPARDASFLETAQKGVIAWKANLADMAEVATSPLKPQRVAAAVSRQLKPGAIVSTDSGTNTSWAAQYLMMGEGMRFSCSGTLASMACGLPYAIAAAIAHPDRQVVAFVGDGGLAMLLGELATVVKYGLDIKIVCLRNNSLGQIRWEQMVFLGNPEYACELQPIDFATVARGFGMAGYTLDDPHQVEATMQEAFAREGPVLIDAVIDPNEPPHTPSITLKQALHLAEALARGTPQGGKIARTIASDVVRQLV